MGNDRELRELFEKYNIHSFNDYSKKMEIWQDFDNRLHRGGQKKIDAFRDAVATYYNGFQAQASGQFISVNPQTCNDEQISNYMCLFPKRSLIETEGLSTYWDTTPFECEESNLPPNDFIEQYFRFQKVLQQDIAYLYPLREVDKSSWCESVSTTDSFTPIRNVAKVSQQGNITTLVQDEQKFYIAFPWLQNARVDDYIEICQKHPAEFDNLANTIERIALSSNGSGNLNDNVLIDLKEALTNIRIALDKRRASLKSKGGVAVVCTCLTIIPFRLSGFFQNFDPKLLSTIIGTSSLVGSSSILNEFFSSKADDLSNPYWVIWKWQEKTERSQNKIHH